MLLFFYGEMTLPAIGLQSIELVSDCALAYGELKEIDGRSTLVPDPSYREVVPGELYQLSAVSIQEQERVLSRLDESFGTVFHRHTLELYQPRVTAQAYLLG